MRLIILTCLTMVAFASNSILNRVGIANGDIDATNFGVVRLLAGAAMLAVLCLLRGQKVSMGGKGRLIGAGSLLLYLFSFSFAYQSLNAGLGALILFGMVQITMFAGAVHGGEKPSAQRWVGASIAFIGLIWLLWPSDSGSHSFWHAGLMAISGIGWGIYSLNGRHATNALAATSTNFLWAALVAIGVVITQSIFQIGAPLTDATRFGIGIAVLCGALTSGVGYAMWYTVLPNLRGTTAAVAQLTVPVIAIAGGSMLLGETAGSKLLIATMVVLGGVLLAVTSRR